MVEAFAIGGVLLFVLLIGIAASQGLQSRRTFLAAYQANNPTGVFLVSLTGSIGLCDNEQALFVAKPEGKALLGLRVPASAILEAHITSDSQVVGQSLQKGTAGKALVGAAVAGVPGAIVGASMSRRSTSTTTQTPTNIRLVITIDNMRLPCLEVTCLSMSVAEEWMSRLRILMNR